MGLKYLWFEVTDKCNSRCCYCNIWQKKNRYIKRLTPRQLYLTLSDKVFRNVRYILNSGGEPTLEPNLLEYYEYEHKALPKATLQLSTNALLPNKVLEVAKAMYEKGCKLQVGISLDGVGEEHDRIRGVKGNFCKIEQLIPELRKYAIVTLGATLTSKTIKENIHALEWAKSQGVPFMFHWLNKSSFYNNLDGDYNANAVIDAVKLLPPSLYCDMWVSNLQGKPVHFNCKALKDFCVLKRNGDMSPCLSFWNVSIGNVFSATPTFLFENFFSEGNNFIKDCKGCLNNWGVCWSLSTFQKYWWWAKEKLKCA